MEDMGERANLAPNFLTWPKSPKGLQHFRRKDAICVHTCIWCMYVIMHVFQSLHLINHSEIHTPHTNTSIYNINRIPLFDACNDDVDKAMYM